MKRKKKKQTSRPSLTPLTQNHKENQLAPTNISTLQNGDPIYQILFCYFRCFELETNAI